MRVFTNTIGIDVSKQTLDVHDYKLNQHHIFKNQTSGFEQILAWVKHNHGNELENILFCFENTGIYSLPLSAFMQENKLAYRVIPTLEIKRSIGMARGKNDQIDAFKIAHYGYLRREEIRPSSMAPEILLKLKDLLTTRERMVKHRGAYQGYLKELTTFYKREKNPLLFESQERMVEEFSQQIKLIEQEMSKLIEEDPATREHYHLARSVKGVGLILGVTLLVYTHNFSRFETWRQFASYSGIAPFEHESGTSLKRPKRVSDMSYKRVKVLLTYAALSTIRHNPEMRIYYEKRVQEGKNKMSVINIIKNKIVARVFAVVKRGTPYVNTMRYAA
jgi:transposase